MFRRCNSKSTWIWPEKCVCNYLHPNFRQIPTNNCTPRSPARCTGTLSSTMCGQNLKLTDVIYADLHQTSVLFRTVLLNSHSRSTAQTQPVLKQLSVTAPSWPTPPYHAIKILQKNTKIQVKTLKTQKSLRSDLNSRSEIIFQLDWILNAPLDHILNLVPKCNWLFLRLRSLLITTSTSTASLSKKQVKSTHFTHWR